MKKILLLLLIILSFPSTVDALEKHKVALSKCIDGDTANFILDNQEITVRFLAIDTPETKHPTKGEEPYGKLASNFTCKKLTNASIIELEYDNNSNLKDKYNRYLAWIFVDNYLLQDEIVKNGLAEVAYLYGEYKYTNTLKEHQTQAKLDKIGIWSNNKEKNNIIYEIGSIFLIIIAVITGLISKAKGKKYLKKARKKYGI